MTQDLSSSPPDGAFDANYLNWKSWGHEAFGSIDGATRRYFDAEVATLPAIPTRGARVLEIGFGQGHFLRYASERGWSVSATEANGVLVDAARAQGIDAHHTLELSSFEDDSFDLVVAFDVLEHVPQELLNAFLNDVKRVLLPKASFLARVPNGDSPLGLINQNGDVTHVNFIGSGKVRYMAKAVGLDLHRVGGEAQPIRGDRWSQTVYRAATHPLRRALERVLNLLFSPRQPIAFCSPNLVFVLRKA